MQGKTSHSNKLDNIFSKTISLTADRYMRNIWNKNRKFIEGNIDSTLLTMKSFSYYLLEQ